MIIVNQNKDEIVNFDNIENIDIVADLDGTGEVPYKIYYETSSKREELGKYKAEERAKEVLQEIVETYKKVAVKVNSNGGMNRERIKVGLPPVINHHQENFLNILNIPMAYEMPKE